MISSAVVRSPVRYACHPSAWGGLPAHARGGSTRSLHHSDIFGQGATAFGSLVDFDVHRREPLTPRVAYSQRGLRPAHPRACATRLRPATPTAGAGSVNAHGQKRHAGVMSFRLAFICTFDKRGKPGA
jgi:hypothetical protein